MIIKRYYQFVTDKSTDPQMAKLRFRVKWNGQIVAFSLGLKVELEKWSQETQRCRLSATHGPLKVQSNVINKEIDRFEKCCDKVFASFELAGKSPTSLEFRDAFNHAVGRDRRVSGAAVSLSFFDVFDLFVSRMGAQNNWTKATHTKFSAIRSHLYGFDPDLSLALFTDQTLQSFVAYQHKIPLRNTTISKNLAFVRWFLRWASLNDYYSGRSHETFRAKLKGVDGNLKEVIHLSWDELIGLYNFDLASATKTLPDGSEVPLETENRKALERVRDVFCFCCFTGLRYSDVAKLSRSDVRDNYISFVTVKTTDALKVELNKYSRAILDKYADFPFQNGRVLPVISNVKMNEALKDLGEKVGLNEPQRIIYYMGNKRHEEVFPKWALLTTHCGRRTFVVNALSIGIPAEVIMKFTGHSDFKSMKPYMKIVDTLKENEMKKFDNWVGSVPPENRT